MPKTFFTYQEAKEIGDLLGIRWRTFDVDQFQLGLNMELEHGLGDSETNVTNDDPFVIARICWAHLKTFPDYYDRLYQMEEQAKFFWKRHPKRSRVLYQALKAKIA